MRPQSRQFEANAASALGDETLAAALAKLQRSFQADRDEMLARLPEFDALRDEARSIRDHVLDHLDSYLETEGDLTMEPGGVLDVDEHPTVFAWFRRSECSP